MGTERLSQLPGRDMRPIASPKGQKVWLMAGRGIIAAMKRLLRWAFNGAAAVSAVFCLTAAGFWAQSQFTTYAVWHNSDTVAVLFGTCKNVAAFGRHTGSQSRTIKRGWSVTTLRPPENMGDDRKLPGFPGCLHFVGFLNAAPFEPERWQHEATFPMGS